MNARPLLGGSAALIAALAVLTPAGPTPGTKPTTRRAKPPWTVIRTTEYAVAIPSGWRRLGPIGRHVIYTNGDGLAVPAADETGAPIQIGMTVERYGTTRDTALAGANTNMKNLQRNPRLKILAERPVESLKLADGAKAALIRVLLRKDGSRKSLQLKLYALDPKSRGWVVSAWLVTGIKSQFIERNPALEARLRAHVTSICFDPAKFSPKALATAYRPAQTQPATTSQSAH